MLSFFKHRPPRDPASLSREELLEILKDFPQRMQAKLDENPVENRIKFAKELRAKLDEWAMEPAVRIELLGIIQAIEAEANAHALAVLVGGLQAELEEWEKQKSPPMREIIRWESELTELLGNLEDIPDRMRKGAAEDVKLLLQRLQKLQE